MVPAVGAVPERDLDDAGRVWLPGECELLQDTGGCHPLEGQQPSHECWGRLRSVVEETEAWRSQGHLPRATRQPVRESAPSSGHLTAEHLLSPSSLPSPSPSLGLLHPVLSSHSGRPGGLRP